ncbi:MAG TPA: malate dehydrogenase [Candidatus Nanoarchaeia archaeon]|nr:malate dehydrogenase [Candidatus Nanoarchaeia archaeon]
MHIAQVGTGRVGRPTAYSIMEAKLADTLTLCDIKPGLAAAFGEELKHVRASTKNNVEIVSCEKDEQVAGADIILISAGEPRMPGVKMSRRDLAVQNAKIVKQISETTRSRNPQAKYVVISNPVDAMAMVCKKYTKAEYVISTGTNLESLRFRSFLAESLKTSPSLVEGWVGGEHGDAAVPLWSTVKIDKASAEEYSESIDKAFQRTEIESYVKSVSKLIVDSIGGTEYGPAASFRDIARAIVKNTNEILPIAAPTKFAEISEPVSVGIPTQVGQKIGTSLFQVLNEAEKSSILEAAKAIYQTYMLAVESIE